MLPFTRLELADAIQRGEVTARRHPSLPYTIYNYSADVQWTNTWNDVTLNCRGLILDDNHNIIARPWKKFFNLGQVDLPIQFDTPVEVMDKADGSLGILYPIVHPEGLDVFFGVATRGSFESDQAKHATDVWNERYARLVKPMPGYTMLFEIIYPSNRIVLNYGDMDDLILLGAVENSTGHYISPQVAVGMWNEAGTKDGFAFWPGPVVQVMPFNSISEALAHTDRSNAEGFVIRSHNFMVKVKQPDYLELHKLVTNASPKTVWEQLRAGKSKSEIISNFPDEFHDYIASMIDPLVERFETRSQEIFEAWGKVMDKVQDGYRPISVTGGPSRKVYAQAFAKHPDKKYFFLLLDSRSIADVLWTELKPKEALIEA